MSEERCPTCGAMCRIISDREGTCYYEPIPGPEYVIVESTKAAADLCAQLRQCNKLRVERNEAREQVAALRQALADAGGYLLEFPAPRPRCVWQAINRIAGVAEDPTLLPDHRQAVRGE